MIVNGKSQVKVYIYLFIITNYMIIGKPHITNYKLETGQIELESIYR